MTATRALVRTAAVTTALYWSGYAAAKVAMAADGRLGMPGRPAPAEAYEKVADPVLAQLGNAALGVGAAILMLSVVVPAVRRVPRVPLLIALTLCAVFTLLGLSATLMHRASWPESMAALIGSVAVVATTVAAYRRSPGTAHHREDASGTGSRPST